MTYFILGGTVVSDVERTLKSLNGYHEDILEALRTAAAQHRSSGNTPSGSISEDILRKTLQECTSGSVTYAEPKRTGSKSSSRENICENLPAHLILDGSQTSTLLRHHHQQLQSNQADEEDINPSVGPLRIRNLEDLIRQLEHHSSRHMSPSGSEDIRMSENEADRHYRIDSSAACSESSHE